jgi:1,4-alpha-glucan branching enzyme
MALTTSRWRTTTRSKTTRLARYLAEANRLLALRGQPPLILADLRPGPSQLKVAVDLCHLFGIAVLADVVYNHAGGGFGDQSIYFFDRRLGPSPNESLYFTDQEWAGGRIFAFWNHWVRQFLIDNAVFLAREYHLDGFRYDEVSLIERSGGWTFAQDLAATVRYARPGAIQIAEYWNDQRWRAIVPPPDGLGFDAAWNEGLQHAIRRAVRQASYGAAAPVSMGAIAAALTSPALGQADRAVNYIENHDLVYVDRPPDRFEPRMPLLADGGNPRSWYARSRCRVALGLLLTAPGIPLLFMGQEFLEDKNWSDNQSQFPGTLIWWAGLTTDSAMGDFHAYARDLVRLRRRLSALRGDRIAAFHVNDADRVIAFHRWLEGTGNDVVVVASLNDSTLAGYRVGFPAPGPWREVLNSDFYDGLPNPAVAGNGGTVVAGGPGMHSLGQSADVVIPANAVVVFAR